VDTIRQHDVRLPDDSSFEIGTTYFAIKKRIRIAYLVKMRLGRKL
jgi:hypothetical protein